MHILLLTLPLFRVGIERFLAKQYGTTTRKYYMNLFVFNMGNLIYYFCALGCCSSSRSRIGCPVCRACSTSAGFRLQKLVRWMIGEDGKSCNGKRCLVMHSQAFFLLVLSQNCEKGRIASCMFVCPSAWNNSTPTGRIFRKFRTRVSFENLPRKYKFPENRTLMTGTLCEDRCPFLIISRSSEC